MSAPIFIDSFGALLPEGIVGPSQTRSWDEGQSGPRDVRRDQVLSEPYVNFGKLMLPDKLAFCAAAVALAGYEPADKERTAITLGIPAGSLSTDVRYLDSVSAGFPSPAVFSATLPSSAITDIAIFFGLKGPNRVIAGSAASELSALECAVSLLASGKATSVVSLSVNAIEAREADGPLLAGALNPVCSAVALLLTTTPRAGALGMVLSASFSRPDDRGRAARDELYVVELVRLLHEGKTGRVMADSCDVAATLVLSKEQ